MHVQRALWYGVNLISSPFTTLTATIVNQQHPDISYPARSPNWLLSAVVGTCSRTKHGQWGEWVGAWGEERRGASN